MQGRNGRSKYYKIVMTPCSGGEVVSFYCRQIAQSMIPSLTDVTGFMPTELTNHHEEGFVFQQVPVQDILKGAYDQLDPDCRALLEHSVERMPWRLYIHRPYDVCLCLWRACRTDSEPFFISTGTEIRLASLVMQLTL